MVLSWSPARKKSVDTYGLCRKVAQSLKGVSVEVMQENSLHVLDCHSTNLNEMHGQRHIESIETRLTITHILKIEYTANISHTVDRA